MERTLRETLVEEMEKDLSFIKSNTPSAADSESTKELERSLAKLKAIYSGCERYQDIKSRIPSGERCFFCRGDKPCPHAHEIVVETYDGGLLGGVALKVRTLTYFVCGDCQTKLWARGAAILLCSSLAGAGIGLLLAMLAGLDSRGANAAAKIVCCAFYAAAFFSGLYSYGRKRLHIIQFFLAALLLAASVPLVLHVHSLSVQASYVVVMALSMPTVLFNFRKDLNLFSRLHGRVVY